MILGEDFQGESIGQVSASAKWEAPGGISSDMAFVDADGDIQVAGGNLATNLVLHTSNPQTANQRVELRFTFPSSAPVGVTAIYLRWTGASAFIRLEIDCNTKQATLTDHGTTLATLDCPDPDATAASVRLEVIGGYARVWYRAHANGIPDEPPDLATRLASAPAIGRWGFRHTGNGGALVSLWSARDLACDLLPAPHLVATDASADDLALTPITATAEDVDGAQFLEWQIYPADPDDFPEAYCDIATADANPRVFFLRPGFCYDIRVRPIIADTPGEWSQFTRFLAPGTKSTGPVTVLPAAVFPDHAPSYVLSRNQDTSIFGSISNTGRESVGSVQARPRNAFKLVFEKVGDDVVQDLLDFFDAVRGRAIPFRWTHPTTGQIYAMRFDADTLDVTYDDHGAEGNISTVDAPIVEVNLGTYGSMTVTMNVDEDLV